MRHVFRLVLLCSFVGLASTPLVASPLTLKVTIDTTPLAGLAGYMAFDLVGGSPLQGNVATVSAFATTGTLGGSSTSGGVTGTLTAQPVVLTASTFFNEYLQAMTFGGGLTTFTLVLTSSFVPGSAPDSFSLFLLDSAFAPYLTSDPTGASALFAIDITDASAPQVFTSASASARVVRVTAPEPGSLVVLLLGLGAMAGTRAFRKAR